MEEDLNLGRLEHRLISKAIRQTRTNLQAVKLLGVPNRTFYNLLKKHNLQPKKIRHGNDKYIHKESEGR